MAKKKTRKKQTKPKVLSFSTTRKVEMIVNGDRFEGTHFTFPTEEIMKARKELLVNAYGEDIIA